MEAPSIRRWSALAAFLVGAAACSEPARPSVLLVTLDTTRADALGAYGGDPAATPHLDRLAADGVRYDAAHTVAPLTLPSHASMMTGLYPLRHSLRDNSIGTLPAEVRTLAECAHDGGYDTAAFVAAVVLDAAFGLDQGFARYEGPARPAEQLTSHYTELPADEVVDRAIAFLDGRAGDERPFFLWVHLFDPHFPYEPPPELAQRFPQRPYVAEVARADAEVGRLLDALETRGLTGETLVALVADHGEALGEHGEETHGAYCWQSTLRVPFVLRYPDGYRAGETSDEVVSVVDLHPTLAEAMGVEPAGDVDGISLYRHRVDADRGVYFECYTGFLSYGWSPLAGWLDADGKYLHSSQPQLFDPREDPGETRDLVDERPELVDRYRRAIGELAAKPAFEAASGAPADLADAIRGLGYAASSSAARALPHPLAPSDRPSPQSMVDEDRKVMSALDLNNAEQYARAEAILKGVLARNPENWFALDQLAHSYIRRGLVREAIEPLETLVRRGPPWALPAFKLANFYAAAGKFDEAAELFARAVELEPANESYRRRFAACLDELDRHEEAERVRASR